MMSSACLHRFYSNGRHGRDEALLVASVVGTGGCTGDVLFMKPSQCHVKEATNNTIERRKGHLASLGKSTPAKRRRSECGKDSDWAIDADPRPGTKRSHNVRNPLIELFWLWLVGLRSVFTPVCGLRVFECVVAKWTTGPGRG